MSRFLTPLLVEVLFDGTKRLTAPLAFESDDLRGVVIVPADFLTDFASTPRGVWGIFPKDGKYSAAAVVHDAAYSANLETLSGEAIHLIKPLADALFRECMKASGVGAVSRTLMWWAVVQFGGRPYGGLGQPDPAPVNARVITTTLPDDDDGYPPEYAA